MAPGGEERVPRASPKFVGRGFGERSGDSLLSAKPPRRGLQDFIPHLLLDANQIHDPPRDVPVLHIQVAVLDPGGAVGAAEDAFDLPIGAS